MSGVRLFYFQGDEYGGCTDMPDSCSVRTAVRSLGARGWTEVELDGVIGNGKAKMINGHGTHVVIETILGDGEEHG